MTFQNLVEKLILRHTGYPHAQHSHLLYGGTT